MAKSFGKQVKKVAKKKFAERAGTGIANIGSGGSGLQQPLQSSSTNVNVQTSSKKFGLFKLVLIAFLFVFAVAPFTQVGADCIESGFCRIKIIEPVKDSKVIEAVQDATKFVGRQATQTRGIIAGEQTFSWEGNVENSDASGSPPIYLFLFFQWERASGVLP